MKAAIILCLLLTAFGGFAAQSPTGQLDAAGRAFWEKFKNAVIKGDKEAVGALSQFPVGMSYGKAKIRTRAQLLKRYREVFNEQTDAGKCFATAKPEVDPARPKNFSVACKDAAGNESVLYEFRLTSQGWRFIALDNLNE